jgi:cytochrome c-type biogenesis protein CcmH/NrfG
MVRPVKYWRGVDRSMSKQSRQAARPAPRESPAKILLAGVVCLAVGFGVGFYFGRQSGQPVGGTAAAQTNTAFIQNEAALRAMIQTNPGDLTALIQLGNLYYDHGRYRDAIDWYGKALEIDPKNPDVRTDRGTSYWNLGQADAAIAEFNKALESDPSHAQTLYNLGVVYLNGKNNSAEARKVWERLLASNPNYPERAKLQQQIAALSGGSPAIPNPQNAAPGMEDLFQRMQSQKK